MNDNASRPPTRTRASRLFELTPTRYVIAGLLTILVFIALCIGLVALLGSTTAQTPTLPSTNKAKVELGTPLQPNAPMTIQGSGFTPGEKVKVYTSGNPNASFAELVQIAETAADGNGNFTAANLAVPPNNGTFYLSGRGDTSGFTSQTAVSGAPTGGNPPQTSAPPPTAAPANLPDLTIGGFYIDTQNPVSCLPAGGLALGLKVEVRNITLAPAGPFRVVVNNSGFDVTTGLQGGRSITLFFPSYQTGNNSVKVDANNNVQEMNENNNEYVAPLPIPTPPIPCTPAPNNPTVTPLGPTNTPDPNALNIWYAQYYNNSDLFEPAIIRRNEPGNPFLNLDWRGGSPGGGIPNDNFSAILTRNQEFANTDNYVFTLTTDDGARLYLDGTLLIDEWRNGAQRTVTKSQSVSKGPHQIKIEYYESTGNARIALSWQASYTGWVGRYYNNTDRSGNPVIKRDDATLDFDWGLGSPAPEIQTDNFSVDWQRSVNFAVAGNYVFTATVDDGIRVYVDGNPVIDSYGAGNKVVTGTRNLNAGAHAIQVQYVEYSLNAKIKLEWERVVPPAPPTPTMTFTPPPASATPMATATASATPIPPPPPPMTSTVPPPPSATPTSTTTTLIIVTAAP